MDLNKSDLLRLLSYLEGELQARDITIAALKAEKAKQLLYQAKYGRFGLGDPFLALQRDSDSQKDNSFDEAAVKAMYDNQLTQLENLIDTQRRAQQRMREQLAAVEKRYHKVCAELDDEKRKHAQDTAQGDDVTYMLEKERERLKQELEFEKSQAKKLDKESKKTTTVLEEERAAAIKHKQVALMLIKERKKMTEQTIWLQQHAAQMEKKLQEEKCRVQGMGSGLAQESQKASVMEALMEKQLNEFDIEREQLKGKLKKEEARNRELSSNVSHLQQQLDQLHRQMGYDQKRGEGPKSIEIKSSVNRSPGREIDPAEVGSQSQVRGGSPGQQPSGAYKVTPPHTPPEARKVLGHVQESPERDMHAAQRPVSTPDAAIKRALLANKDRTIGAKPIPAEKPPELSGPRGATLATPSSAGQVYTVPQTGTTVFTTPSGTRISLTTGPSPNQPRKMAPGGRGVPPPVPPNKPQVVIPGNSQPRKDSPGRPLGATLPIHQPVKPQPPAKVVTTGKEKMYFSDSENPGDSVRHMNSNKLSVVSNSPNILQTGSGDANPMRKPSQVCVSNMIN